MQDFIINLIIHYITGHISDSLVEVDWGALREDVQTAVSKLVHNSWLQSSQGQAVLGLVDSAQTSLQGQPTQATIRTQTKTDRSGAETTLKTQMAPAIAVLSLPPVIKVAAVQDTLK